MVEGLVRVRMQNLIHAARRWALAGARCKKQLLQDMMGGNRPTVTSVPGENSQQSRSLSKRNKPRNTLLHLRAPWILGNTRRAPPTSTTDGTSTVTSSVCEPEETIYLADSIPACSNIVSRHGPRLYSTNRLQVHPPSITQVTKSKPGIDVTPTVALPGQVEEVPRKTKCVHFAPDFKLSRIVEDGEMLLPGKEMNFPTETKHLTNSLSITHAEKCPEQQICSIATCSYTPIQTFEVPLNQSGRAKQYKIYPAQPSMDLSRTVQQRRRPDTPFQSCRGEPRGYVQSSVPYVDSLLPARPIAHKYQLPEQPILNTLEIAFPRDDTVPPLPYVPMPGSIFIDDDFDIDKEWNSIPVYETVLSDDDSSDDSHSDSEFGDEESINSLESYLRSDDEEMREDDRDLLGLFQKDISHQAFEEKVKRLKQRYPHERVSMIHRIIHRQSTEKEQWKRVRETCSAFCIFTCFVVTFTIIISM